MTYMYQPITADELKAAYARGPWRFGEFEDILGEVAEKTGITVAQMKSADRTYEVTRARWLAVWKGDQAKVSRSEMGRALGKDHTSVKHGIDRMNGLIAKAKQSKRDATTRTTA